MLAVLRSGPVHGYELKRRVQRTTLTALSNNSLYPILRRFEQNGIVTKSVEAHPGRPDRNVYTITDAGRGLLAELISVLPPQLAANDEEFLVRVSFFQELEPAQRLAILAVRASILDAAIEQVTTLLSESDPGPTGEWRNLTIRQLIQNFERERRWITELETKAGS
ncbi:MAG: PadR family transcriptional regulator [Rhodoglobus sp.]|nr:PadR family transcriptional regulator [Rhodoglobus sp.]